MTSCLRGVALLNGSDACPECQPWGKNAGEVFIETPFVKHYDDSGQISRLEELK
jgi:hypothetical protein